MTTENEPEVKDVGVEYIKDPAGKDDENVEDPESTDPDSSQEQNDGNDEDDSAKPDELIQHTPAPKPDTAQGDGLAEVDGETPKERALRLEVTKLRGMVRGNQGHEIFGVQPPAQAPKKEIAPEKAAIIGKYKPEEIQSLREVLPILAEEMGYVSQNELQGQTYAEKAQEALDTFLDAHPEYTVDNDKEGTLWDAFKAEYSLYKQPTNPKDFPKIFNKVHKDVFGIKPAGALKTVTAQQEKTKVASHAGSSPAPTSPARSQKTAKNTGYRLDMLKGFSEEDLKELGGE